MIGTLRVEFLLLTVICGKSPIPVIDLFVRLSIHPVAAITKTYFNTMFVHTCSGYCDNAQKPPLNDHADVASLARGLRIGLSLHLHPYFACCEQRRLRRVCAYAQSRQSLHCSLI